MSSMNPGDALKRIVESRTANVYENPFLLEALLRDYCPDDRAAVYSLVNALKEQVPQSILSAPAGSNREALAGRLRERLRTAFYMEEARAQWTVETWMSALAGTPTDAKKLPDTAQEIRKTQPRKADEPTRIEVLKETPKKEEPKKVEPPKVLIELEPPMEWAKKRMVEGIQKQQIARRIEIECRITNAQAMAMVEQAWQSLPADVRRKRRAKDILLGGLGVTVGVAALVFFGFFIFTKFLPWVFHQLGEASSRASNGDYFGALYILIPVAIVAFIIFKWLSK